MTSVYLLLTVVAGAILSFQVGINNSLRNFLGSPIIAAFVSFFVGTIFLLCFAFISRSPWPNMSALAKTPVWSWIGGILGAYYIATAIFVSPKLGAASFISIIVGMQLITSLALDHFGMIGFAQHSINIWRILGAILLMAGVVLIVKN
jgi:transporter family-2 protein